jgi:hypothetical protein
MVAHIYNPSYLGSWRQKDNQCEDSLAKLASPFFRKKIQNKGLVAWLLLVECLSKQATGFGFNH